MRKAFIALLIVVVGWSIRAAALPDNAESVVKEITALTMPNARETRKLAVENTLLRFFSELKLSEQQIESFLKTFQADLKLQQELAENYLEVLEKEQQDILNNSVANDKKYTIDPLEKRENTLKRRILWLSFLKELDPKQREKLTDLKVSSFLPSISQFQVRADIFKQKQKTRRYATKFSTLPRAYRVPSGKRNQIKLREPGYFLKNQLHFWPKSNFLFQPAN